jgi:hypothetical protein
MQHEDPQGVLEADVLELARRGVDEREVLGQQGAAEAAGGMALPRHERMFALPQHVAAPTLVCQRSAAGGSSSGLQSVPCASCST